MEFGLDKLFCWQTAVFSLAIWVVTFGLRRVLEKLVPVLLDKQKKASGWWSEVVVPAIPIVIGCASAALITKTFPYPEGLDQLWGRIMFGMLCGLASSKVHQIVWGALKNKAPSAP